MYFKIEKTGCSTHEYLVNVRYDLFLEPSDHKYSEFRVLQEDKTYRDNPFTTHFCQFEPDVTTDELLYVGQLALELTYSHWIGKGKHVYNAPIPTKIERTSKRHSDCENKVNLIKSINFSKVQNAKLYNVKE